MRHRVRRSADKKAFVAAKQAVVADTSPREPLMPRAGSKLAMLVVLLEREGGATVAELVAATGWQPHFSQRRDFGRASEEVRSDDCVGAG